MICVMTDVCADAWAIECAMGAAYRAAEAAIALEAAAAARAGPWYYVLRSTDYCTVQY